MDFSRIQSQISLNIDFFMKNYLARSLKICGSESFCRLSSKNSKRYKISIRWSIATEIILQKGTTWLYLHTKFEFDRLSNSWHTDVWIFWSLNAHTHARTHAHPSGRFFLIPFSRLFWHYFECPDMKIYNFFSMKTKLSL